MQTAGIQHLKLVMSDTLVEHITECTPLHIYFYTAGAYATDTRTFGQGTGLILLDELRCTGNETRLINCPSNEIGVHNCRHVEDIGVSCPGNL